jgi:hypothetical protein
MSKDNLANILKDWDKNLKPGFKDSSAFKDNIMSQIRAGHKNSPDSNEYFFVKKIYVYKLAAAAAIFLIISGVWLYNLKPGKLHPETPASLAIISKDDIADVKKISREVCRLFNDRIRWIIKSGDNMEIKPSDIFDTSLTGSKILVRQTVFRKTVNGWEKVYIADIITSPEQQVVFNDSKTDGYIWTHQAGDSVIALEGQMKIRINGEIINLNYSGGQADRTSVLLKEIKNSNSEYLVYQTVNRI